MKNANGYGSVVNLGKKRRKPYGIRFTVGYDDNGKQLYKYASYHKTRKEANTELAKLNLNRTDINKIDTTLEMMFDKWYKVKEDTVSEKTLEWYRIVKDKLSPILKKPIKDIKLNHLQNILNPESAETQKRIKGATKQIFNLAIANDIINKNYPEYLSLKKATRSTLHKPFTLDDINILWNNLSLEYVDIVLIMIYSGVRPNEIRKLRNDKIFIKEKYFITGSKTESGKDRYIPMNNKIIELIKKRRNNNKEYFLNEGYINYFTADNLKYRFNKVMELLDMNYTPYDCRHTFATIAISLNIPIEVISKILGHKDIKTTEKKHANKHIENKDIIDAESYLKKALERMAILDKTKNKRNSNKKPFDYNKLKDIEDLEKVPAINRRYKDINNDSSYKQKEVSRYTLEDEDDINMKPNSFLHDNVD